MKAKVFTAFFLVFAVAIAQVARASFTDVNGLTQYAEAILYAQDNNIVSGYPDGSFKPQNFINRVEFTKIIVGAALNYDSSKDPSGYDIYALFGVGFNDVISGEWYIPYLRKAVENGIVSGYPDGSFKPGNDVSFVEAAKIIVNGFGYNTAANAVWYKPYVEKLAELKAVPLTVMGFDYRITRAEMAEMIYRIKTGNTDFPSKDYSQLEEVSVSYGALPMIGSCSIFPADNPWNTDVSNYPLDPNSDNYIAGIGADGHLHPDFGGGGEYGIPYNVVDAGQPQVPLLDIDYADESDPGPYPIPADAKIENGSDAHVLVVDEDNCLLYELFAAVKVNGGWNAGSAAKFDLRSNALRPDGWTSADAAGLPIFPGLVRYDEVAAGAVNHAVRFTVTHTQNGYIHPATHFASESNDPNLPPMGLRLRMKADYDISGLTGASKVIAEGLKKYGMIMADNGSDWYITGAADPGWDDEDLNQLKSVPGSAFEVVQTGPILR